MSARKGSPAPPLALRDHHGESFDLAGDGSGKVAVVFFYPKDFTPGCTAESCGFRDAYEDFVEAGALVIGVSSDDEATHRRFAAQHRLPFTLLADVDGVARAAWGVPKTLGLMAGRVTYVVDADGIVRHLFNSQLNALKHVREALRVVRELA